MKEQGMIWHGTMSIISRFGWRAWVIGLSAGLVLAATASDPQPPGKLVTLGSTWLHRNCQNGHKLHVNCTGKGSPTVVIESGLGDFSFDWVLVQSRVSGFTRICTYDRAGYAWSEAGPKPRTFAQLNLELHDALMKLGERSPYVLVGHSYGGPVVRNFAATYPQQTAGMVLVDASFEGQRVGIGGKKMMQLGDGAKGLSIPPAREKIIESDKPVVRAEDLPEEVKTLDPIYKALPPAEQKLHLWAQQLPGVYDAEISQREWSAEYFAKWLATPQTGTLGAIPLVILTRAEGGFDDDMEIPAAQLEKERKDGQAKLAQLSTNDKEIFVHSGHNMDLEAPDDVTAAIREVVEAVRHHGKL